MSIFVIPAYGVICLVIGIWFGWKWQGEKEGSRKMSEKCFFCKSSEVVAILGREIEREEHKIVFHIFVCKEHYLEWFKEKKKEGFK